MDSGCSNQIIDDKRVFSHLDEMFSSQVELVDSKQVKIEGKEMIVAHTYEGKEKHIYDVH